jgi:5-methylcytosine-specific restriction endonuclease McrA
MYRGDPVRPLCLFAIYGWKCGLCPERIDPRKRHPDPMCGTIDHIIPLSMGGEHTWQNCQPAHKRCNEAKADALGWLECQEQVTEGHI